MDEIQADPLSEQEFASLISKITRDRGFGCASYKDKCLRRRIAVRMRARGVHTYGDYARVLDADAREYELLLDALTINVTKLFRNWEVFDTLSRTVVPALWERDGPIRVWSAGCASGEEAYSLAVLFHRHAEERGELSRLGRVSILGTDIDRGCLDAAAKGETVKTAFTDTPPGIRERYFEASAPFNVRAEAANLVRVARHDLVSEPPPGVFDLIACRNVIIYFDRDTQESLFERFYAALNPGRFLVLGKVETLLGPARVRFAPVAARERIFRRL